MTKDCQCAFCKAKRGEYNAQNNPNYRNGSRVLSNKTCLYCNKQFVAYANRKYCSRYCMNKYIWEYTDKKQKVSAKTTGRKCSEENKANMRKNHANVCGINNSNWKGGIDLLRNYIYRLSEYKQWIKKIFERDNYTCQICGSKDDLTVDHIIPIIYRGENHTDNFQTLCRSCNSGKLL